MEYKLILHNNDEDEKYDGHFEIKKMKWILSDCGSYLSDQWIELLNFMKGITNPNISPIINPGGPSSWNAKIKNSIFELCFDVSGGDCSRVSYW